MRFTKPRLPVGQDALPGGHPADKAAIREALQAFFDRLKAWLESKFGEGEHAEHGKPDDRGPTETGARGASVGSDGDDDHAAGRDRAEHDDQSQPDSNVGHDAGAGLAAKLADAFASAFINQLGAEAQAATRVSTDTPASVADLVLPGEVVGGMPASGGAEVATGAALVLPGEDIASAVAIGAETATAQIDGQLVLPGEALGNVNALVDLVLPSALVLSEAFVHSTSVSKNLIDIDNMLLDGRFAHLNGSGVTVAVLDSGIDINHPFFGPDANSDGVADRIVYQYDFGNNDADASDFNNHGSNVASIIGAQDATYGGMAPGVNLIVLKVFTDAGGGDNVMLANALQWLVANGAAYNLAAVNMSLGFNNNDTSSSSHAELGINDEIAVLASSGVAVVSAAGNTFFGFGSVQGVAYPASDPNSWAVTSVWDSDVGGVGWGGGASDFTTGPDRLVSHAQRSETQTDIVAPGALITGASATGGIVTMGGTSQATPHVSGVVALAQQLAREITGGTMMDPATLRTLMRSSAVTVNDGDNENDNVVNTGLNFPRVDVDNLMSAIYSSYNTATAGGDLLRGANGLDTLSGLGGDDTILGRGGSDVLNGDSGNDSIDGGDGSDSLAGGADSDTISGGTGGDTLNGGAGSDIIDGGTGADRLDFADGIANYLIYTVNDGGTLTTRVVDQVGGGGTDAVSNVETLRFAGVDVGVAGQNLDNISNVVGSRFDDVVFHNSVTGQSVGSVILSDIPQGTILLTGENGSQWQAYEVGDISGDGIADVVYQSTIDGQIAIGQMSAGGVTAYAFVEGGVTTAHRVVGAGDIDLDGWSDLLVQDIGTGIVYAADMTGTAFGGWVAVSSEGTDWQARGIGDVNRDGYADIVYQSIASGDIVAGLEGVGGVLTGYLNVGNAAGWTVKEVADVNNDGYLDVLVQNDSNGDISYANMAGGVFSGWGTVLNGFGTAWQLEGMADTNNDGDADAIIRNVLGSGDTYTVNMDGGNFQGFTLIAQGIGPDWYVV